MPLKTPPQNYLSTLLALREYYAPLVEHYGKLHKQALDNLNHAEALLANWPEKVIQNNHCSPSEQGAVAVVAAEKEKDSSNDSQKKRETETELAQTNTDLKATDNVETEHSSVSEEQTHTQLEIPQLNDTNLETPSSDNSNAISVAETASVEFNPDQEDSSLDSGDDTEQTQGEEEETNDVQPLVLDTKQTDVSSVSPEDNQTASDESTPVAQENLSSDNDNNTLETEDELLEIEDTLEDTATDEVEIQSSSDSQTTSSDRANVQQTLDEPRSVEEIPMKDEYSGLRRIEAVQKLLEEHPGNICHVDFVMRALYGELEPDTKKIVRGRVQSTLTQGKNSGLWFLVPGKPGYYSIDLKSLKSNQKSSSSQPENNKKPSDQSKANATPMKEEFEGKFLIDALASLLQQNPGKVFNPTQAMEALYGEVDPEKFYSVKTRVLNELSRGYRIKRFSRVPGEKGLYTWDVTLLS